MSDIDKNADTRKHYISVMAMVSLSLGVLGLVTIAWRLLAYHPWWSEYVARNVIGLLAVFGLVFGYSALAGISKRRANIVLLVISSPLLLMLCSYLSIGLFRSRIMWFCSPFLAIAVFILLFSVLATPYWKSWFGRKWRAASLATLGMVMSIFLAGSWWVETCAPVSTALSMVCGHNLKRIGDAMKLYEDENEAHYPDPNQWCDVLLQHTDVDVDWFLCPAVKFRWRRQVFPFPIPKYKKCYYAMNPSCESSSPDDTVFLFEITGGWNKSGGLELISAKNHGGHFCNVVFADGHVNLVREKQFAELNWGVRGENE